MTPVRAATLEQIRFGEFLLERARITEEQWLAALADHWSAPRRPRIGEARTKEATASAGSIGDGSVRTPAGRGAAPPAGSIGATIVAHGYLPAEVVEAEARVFHDELDVVEVVPISLRPRSPALPI